MFGVPTSTSADSRSVPPPPYAANQCHWIDFSGSIGTCRRLMFSTYPACQDVHERFTQISHWLGSMMRLYRLAQEVADQVQEDRVIHRTDARWQCPRVPDRRERATMEGIYPTTWNSIR